MATVRLIVVTVAFLLAVALASSSIPDVPPVPRIISNQLTRAEAGYDSEGNVLGYQVPALRHPGRASMPSRRAVSGVESSYISGGYAWALGISLGDSSLFYVNFDTGSSDLIVSGQYCSQTGCTTGTSYSPSGSYQQLQCTSSDCAGTQTGCDGSRNCAAIDCYGDGSGALSYVSKDVFGIPGLSQTVTAIFGNMYEPIASSCSSSPVAGAGFLALNWTGLMGSSFSALSSWGDTNLPLDKLIAANGLPNIFSLCVTSTPFMSIGADYYCNSNFVYTPITSSSEFDIDLTDFGLASTSFGLSSSSLNSGGTLIDSGTTLIYLNTQNSNALWSGLRGLCGTTNLVGICDASDQSSSVFNTPTQLTGAQRAVYPNIYFDINGIQAVLKPADYFYLAATPNYFILGINLNSNRNILGDLFMQYLHVVFDKERGQLGFGPLSTCSLSQASTNCNITRTTSSSTGAASSLESPFQTLINLY